MNNLQINTRVRRLFQYLLDFEEGKIQVPPFQRDFVWKNDKKIELLDSLKNGYPIGSVLFWQPSYDTKSNLIDEELQTIGGYFLENNKSEFYYILDGYQRLSTLFGCFVDSRKTHLKKNEKEWKEKFDIVYNLKDDKFEFNRKTKTELEIYQIPLYFFTDGDNFYDFSISLMNLNFSENEKKEFINRYKNFGSKISSYDIPSIDLIGGSIKEAVEIFSRLNSRGEVISDDWKVSALSFNKERNFRFGSEVDQLFEKLSKYNFFVNKEDRKTKRELILQCVLNTFEDEIVYFDVASTSKKLEELASRSKFIDVSRKAFINIEKAVDFLFHDLCVFDSKLLPYNIQLIFLTDFFNKTDNPTPNQLDILKKWFWTTTYSNYFTSNLSKQRSAYQRFQQFILNEKIDPIFYDKNETLYTLDFPEKINMASVRAKSLALFMINYSRGIEVPFFNLVNVNVEVIEFAHLFSKPQKENLSENFVPIIKERRDFNENYMLFVSLHRNKKVRNNYSFLLNEERLNLFITSEMVRLYDGTFESEKLILDLRREEIVKAEKKFVDSLNIFYNEPINF